MGILRAFRNIRLVLGLLALAGVCTAGIVGWATGFFADVVGWVSSRYDAFMTWISEPMSWEHLFAGAGVLLVPLALLMALMVLTER